MLHYNTEASGTKAHLAHAAVVGMHALCCGLPAAFALFGAALGAFAWAAPISALHNWLHGYEPEILLLSFSLVAIGGVAEWRIRKARRGVPKLYALSLACFIANSALVAEHRLNPGTMQASTQVFALPVR
jgi:hypothetical protein